MDSPGLELVRREKELLRTDPEMPKGVSVGYINTDSGWRLELRIQQHAIEDAVDEVRTKLLELLGKVSSPYNIEVITYIRRQHRMH